MRAAGFAFGGPIGALLGGLAGHAVDRLAQETDIGDGSKQIAFTIGVIVLSAKMAKADGVVTRDEIDAFKQVFRVPAHETANVAKIFNQARRDSAGFEPYAKQLAGMFHDNPAVLEELLDCLAFIGQADGVLEGRMAAGGMGLRVVGVEAGVVHQQVGAADELAQLGVGVVGEGVAGAHRLLAQRQQPVAIARLLEVGHGFERATLVQVGLGHRLRASRLDLALEVVPATQRIRDAGPGHGASFSSGGRRGPR